MEAQRADTNRNNRYDLYRPAGAQLLKHASIPGLTAWPLIVPALWA